MRQEQSSSPRWGTGFWGRSASSWLCGLLLLAACLGFYSNVFRLIPGWRQIGESRSSTEGRPLQGQRESLPSSQDGRRVVPQGMLLETKQCSERDCPPDACRVPEVPRMVYPKAQLLQPARADVLVMTPWFAPVIWDGVFDSAILDAQFENTTVGLTIFAIKKYVVFLELFLQTAEKHFMVGHKVTYYVFTDRPGDVPRVPLGEGRQVVVLEVQNYSRWQDVSMHRMEMISNFSRQRFLHEVDYLVCADVDMRFRDHVGVEILSPLFGTLHPGFYGAAREAFTYERRPQSQAHVPRDEGDFYYAGGFFGGSVAEVLRLTSACHQAMVVDRAHGIEAVWHDESHLNRYLLYHKPTKVLSPEYLWDEHMLQKPPFLRKLRFVAVPKNHAEIRH
ncbi:histo-blood group ABO system transferase 2-like [Leopardus geoffroyi]|uniref:histo-blood group ABO system transferase 2-like n=1 Tax=Leopardus geoffroyi TaxID=46844 RepID=UPI001E261679|nr:histo-blood group ABO system transferase 2-like [Leopardus geoffroyi]